MTKMQQMTIHARSDGSGPIEKVIPIVNDNAQKRAAMRDADAAMRAAVEEGARADALRQAREKRRQLRAMLRDACLVSVGAGAALSGMAVGLAIDGLCPWWVGVAGMMALAALVYAARGCERAGN